MRQSKTLVTDDSREPLHEFLETTHGSEQILGSIRV